MKFLLNSFLICILIQIIIGVVLIRRYEKKEWNNGICPKCGDKWRLFDIDSQGGRMYRCNNWHFCNVSCNVDKFQ